MPEIEEECIFVADADKVSFVTGRNGDTITIHNLNMNKNQSASMAWLVNQCTHLHIEIRPCTGSGG